MLVSSSTNSRRTSQVSNLQAQLRRSHPTTRPLTDNATGFLTQLWAADTQKAKFSLLAKAYSMIRDLKGKRDAPLDVFLSVTCPKIGIVSAKDYLAVFGWQVRTHGDGQVTLDRSSAAVALSNQMCTTNMSVRDLIDHCKNTMYITDNDVRCITEPGGTDGAPDLVMAALPSDRDSKTRKSSPSKARSASPVRMLSNTNHSLPHYASMPSPMLYRQSAAPAYMFGFSHDNVLVNGTSNNLAYHSLDYHSQQPRVTINHTSPMQTSTPVSHGSGTIDPRLFPGIQPASNVSYDSNLSPGFAGQPTQPNIWAGHVASLPSASYAQGSVAHYDHNDIFDPSSGDPFDAYNISSFGDPTSMDDKSFWQL